MAGEAVLLTNAELLRVTQMDQVAAGRKPDGAYYYEGEKGDNPDDSGFVACDQEGEPHPIVMKDSTGRPDRTWGRRGYPLHPLHLPDPPAGVSPLEFQKAYKVAAYLKRAWEWPYLMDAFAESPGTYLTTEIPRPGPGGPTVTITIADLHTFFGTAGNDRAFTDVATAAATLGMGGMRHDAETILLEMIHLIHGNYIPWQVGCK